MNTKILNDKYWIAVVDFLNKNHKNCKNIFAEAEFELFGIPIVGDYNEYQQVTEGSILIIHKARDLNLVFVQNLITDWIPIFANEVFIIFSGNSKLKREDTFVHYKSFLKKYIGIGSNFAKVVSTSDERLSIYIGNFRAITKTIYGHKIIVDTRDLSLAPHILIDGYWERWITNVFLDLIKPGMNIIDIGANIGFYSLLAADRLGGSGNLTCFEANPEMADLVFQNLQINGFGDRSNVINKAVFFEDGPLTFNLYEKFLGSSSIWADLAHVENYRDKIKKITVEGITLDSHFPSGSVIDFIKIDAEGAEPFILKGAKRLLKENPDLIIMMEFSPAIIAVAYGSVELFYDEIASFNFTIWKIEHDSSLRKLERKDVLSVSHCDVVLKP